MKQLLIVLVLLLVFPAAAHAQTACAAGSTCVPAADMQLFLQALREKKCLVETPPTLTADPVTIVIDKQGRVYGSGSDPHPFTLHMKWCTYDLTATGQTKLLAAQAVEPQAGFRFRPKATLGILAADLLSGQKFSESIDGGILLEPAYFQWVNLNGYVGVRSVGAGFGFDVTKNFGAYVGYAATWGTWRSNPFVSAYFSFW